MILIPESAYEIRNTDKKGRGVFARTDIEPGVIVGDYLGKIIDPNEVDAEEDKFHEELYYALVTERQAILPDKNVVGVHFINHSCEPNIAFYPYNGHILYVTLRKIFAGEEFTVNYLIDPEFGEMNFYLCHCGAPTCKGTWYIHPRKIKTFEEMFIKSASRQRAEDHDLPFGASLPPLPEYPPYIDDNSFYDLFGSSTVPPMVHEDVVSMPEIEEIRKEIRESGKELQYPKMNVLVRGILDDFIVAVTDDTPKG